MRELQKRYQSGRIPFTTCRYDARFSYCLYVPECHQVEPKDPARLVVVVHGSARTAESFRDGFIEFAEREGCIILAPLFPVGAVEFDTGDGYKMQPPVDYAYDQLLLAMVDEVASAFNTEESFLLYGFSGGAQFAHRFYYRHPERLTGLAVHAPGQVCMPDKHIHADLLEALRQVPVQLVIGSDDREELSAGVDRGKLLRSLRDAFTDLGVCVCFKVVAGAGHDGFALLPAAQRFLSQVLSESSL